MPMQLLGSGVLNISVVAHKTQPVLTGERANLVFKFVLVPRDEDAAKRPFKRWPEVSLSLSS